MDGSSVAGVLIVQNGKRRGTRVALTVPVTLIGAAERCDVRVQGPAVADVHCLISVTPAGPALRSWQPDATKVNGAKTAAGILHDGDILQVGPCLFRFVWTTEEIVSLSVAPPEEPVVALAEPGVADELWDLQAREAALHRHEVELANMLDERQKMLSDMVCELAAHREELRLKKARDYDGISEDRAAARKSREQAQEFLKAARKERTRAKGLYARFLVRMKAKWSAERLAAEAERSDIARVKADLASESAKLKADRERFHAEAEAYRHRLTESWALLTEGQRRLLADRQEAERAQAIQQETIERQSAEVQSQAQALESGRARCEARVQELLAEVARLDVRAAQCRAVVQQLENRRTELERTGTKGDYDSVPVDHGVMVFDAKRDATELLTQLTLKERDLSRERGGLIVARTELERQVADLYDQRCVLSEQAAALVVAREAWQLEEYRTVSELENLARGLAHRELSLDARDREIEARDGNSRLRDENLREYRKKLDQWQSDLTDRETALTLADRDLAAKREHLVHWEQSLMDVAREWATDHEREIKGLRFELTAWSTARAEFQTKESKLDRERLELLSAASRVASTELAGLEAQGTKGTLAGRRFRVLRKRWEKHFQQLCRDLEKRHADLMTATVAAEARHRDLARQLVLAHEQQAAKLEQDRLREIARRVPEPAETEPVILSMAGGRIGRTAGSELVSLRAA